MHSHSIPLVFGFDDDAKHLPSSCPTFVLNDHKFKSDCYHFLWIHHGKESCLGQRQTALYLESTVYMSHGLVLFCPSNKGIPVK